MDNTVHWIMNLYPVHRVTAFPNVYSPKRFIWWIALCNVWKLVYRFCQTLHKIWSLDLYLKHLFLPWDINEGTWLPQCREDGTLWKIKETFWIIECSFSAEYWILTTMKTWLLGFDVSNKKKWRGDPMPGSGFGVWLMFEGLQARKAPVKLLVVFFSLLRFSQCVAREPRLVVLFICLAKWNEIR